jgi:multicomponent Na+:H+ antiporter subunit E
MRYITLFILSFIFWLLLTFNLDISNLIVGLIASAITAIIFGKYFIKDAIPFLQPLRYFWLIIYLFIFTWECIKANFDVAYRVLHPAMPIKPGIVKVKLGLKTNLAKTILANSITMTPGTITVDIIDDEIFIHWIYVYTDNPEEYSQKISVKFEKYIKKIFE